MTEGEGQASPVILSGRLEKQGGRNKPLGLLLLLLRAPLVIIVIYGISSEALK